MQIYDWPVCIAIARLLRRSALQRFKPSALPWTSLQKSGLQSPLQIDFCSTPRVFAVSKGSWKCFLKTLSIPANLAGVSVFVSCDFLFFFAIGNQKSAKQTSFSKV